MELFHEFRTNVSTEKENWNVFISTVVMLIIILIIEINASMLFILTFSSLILKNDQMRVAEKF